MEWLAALGGAVADPGYAVTVFLLSLRLGTMLLLTPVLYAASVPAPVRVLLVVGLSASLAPGMPGPGASAQLLSEPAVLLACALGELALGLTLALGIFVAFAAVSMAGRLIDVQVGFGMAQVFDPATNRQVTVIGSALDHLWVLVFFLAGGHHALLRGLALTLERFPPGQPWPLEATLPMVVQQLAALLTLGLAIAAPVVATLLLLDLALGVVGRNLPQLNMLVLGVPVKVVVGIAVLALWLPGMATVLGRVYATVLRSWDASFAALPLAGAR